MEGDRTNRWGGFLLLVTGLASAAAAIVLIGETPLGIESLNQWAICATRHGGHGAAGDELAIVAFPGIASAAEAGQNLQAIHHLGLAMVTVAVHTTVALIFVDELPIMQGCLAVGLLVRSTVRLSLLAWNQSASRDRHQPLLPLPGSDLRGVRSLPIPRLYRVPYGSPQREQRPQGGWRSRPAFFLCSLWVSAVLFACSPPSTGRRTGKSTWLTPKRKTCLPASRSAGGFRLPPAKNDGELESRPPEPESSGDPYSSKMNKTSQWRRDLLGNTESAWSWGVRSTVYLPGYSKGEVRASPHALAT